MAVRTPGLCTSGRVSGTPCGRPLFLKGYIDKHGAEQFALLCTSCDSWPRSKAAVL